MILPISIYIFANYGLRPLGNKSRYLPVWQPNHDVYIIEVEVGLFHVHSPIRRSRAHRNAELERKEHVAIPLLPKVTLQCWLSLPGTHLESHLKTDQHEGVVGILKCHALPMVP